MGSPIGSTGSTTFVRANIEGHEYAGTAWIGFTGNICRCKANGTVVDLRQANWLAQDKRGWYRIRADKNNGKDNSGINYVYNGTYDLSSRESVQYAQIDIDNTSDSGYSGGGRIDFTVYWAAIGPLVVPTGTDPTTDPNFNTDNWFSVEVEADPANGGVVSGGGVYLGNNSCTITATPNLGWQFSGWTSSNGATASTATHTFTVDSDVMWTAHFTQISYTVAVVASPAASGTVSGGGTYYRGDSCTITATPVSGKSFIRWEASDGSSPVNTATHSFTVTGNVTWTAIFQEGWLIKVRIVRGAQLGYIARPTTWRATRTDNYRTLDFTVIENTPTSYVAVVEPVAFNLGDFKVHLNDESASEIALVRVVKGWEPGDYTKDTPFVGSSNLPTVPASYGVRWRLGFDGAEVEIYLRRKSTGELLYGSSGALLHGTSGNPLYL